ncbi:MAG: hypothetical protein Q7R62_02795 [bacterium]|nr:hypothetical protein [bacterium]
MSKGRLRNEVGTELIRAGTAGMVQQLKGENLAICRLASLAFLVMYRRGGVRFDRIMIEPAYESDDPHYPVTTESIPEVSSRVMPERELIRTWRADVRFGKLPITERHFNVRSHTRRNPKAPGVVVCQLEIQGYFHSYELGWEPGIVWATCVEPKCREPVTTAVGFFNSIIKKSDGVTYEPSLQQITPSL